MSDEGVESRLAEEVSSLSIKLVESLQKQLELEQIVHNVNRELIQLKARNQELTSIESDYNLILLENKRLIDELNQSRVIQRDFESKNAELNAEVEDLTASLFDEANRMVSDASRETHNFKIKNRRLIEELDEKDEIISSLQQQLTDLKLLMNDMEDNEKKRNSIVPVSYTNINDDDPLNQSIYSPTIRSIRLDLNNYNHDFKSFIYSIIKPDFIFELSYLKTFRFFKKLWQEEIEVSLSSVPAISQNTLFKNFQRGKTFWSSIVEGRAIIEPIKGTNESFKLSYKGDINPGEAPVAIEDPCSICGENRDDNLEHSRLYFFKLLQDLESNEVIACFPLCNYCVIKIRNICDFFAKLRLINKNIYKLSANSLFDEFSANSNTQFSQFKLNSNSSLPDNYSNSNLVNSNKKRILLDSVEEAKLIKIYMSLILIRSKIFWSKLGIWDNYEEIKEINIDETKLQTFISYAELNTPDIDYDMKSMNIHKDTDTLASDVAASIVNSELSPKTLDVEQEQEKEQVKKHEIKDKQEDPDILKRRSQVEAAELKSKEIEILKQDKLRQEMLSQEAQRNEALEQERLFEEAVEQQSTDDDIPEDTPEVEIIGNNEQTLVSEKKDNISDSKPEDLIADTKVEQKELSEKKDLEKQQREKKIQELAKKRAALKAKIQAENEQEEKDKVKPNSRKLNLNTKSRVSEMIKRVEANNDKELNKKSETDDDDDDEFQNAEDAEPAEITRKNSTSKLFTKKINQDLDDTLELLKSSIVE
jgi:hypothetical protein